MTRVGLCSAKGSPGVTTLSCALAAVWPPNRRVVMAECDPSGGDVAARFGLSQKRGMTSLVLAHRQDPAREPQFSNHVQCLPGGLEILVAPVSADSAVALDRELGLVGATALGSSSDVLMDCGRLIPGAPGQKALLQSADLVFLVFRPDVSGMAHLESLIDSIGTLEAKRHRKVALLPVGHSTFATREVQDVFGFQVLEPAPIDTRAASTLSGAPGNARIFARSALVSWAGRTVARVVDTAAHNALSVAGTMAESSRSTSTDESESTVAQQPSVDLSLRWSVPTSNGMSPE
jgi:MinD-like ATPase involved in chromosome partitioning or flagellar assembly